MSRTQQEELVDFLSDMYSLEQQALSQLSDAPKLAEEEGFKEAIRIHETETKNQAAALEERLEALGGSASVVKDQLMKLGGKGFLAFAKMMPETPGRLLAHSYAFEALEMAGYDVLARLADAAADSLTRDLAIGIRGEEAAMLERLEDRFDAVERISHSDADDALADLVVRHLAEAHALEMEAVRLLEKGLSICEDSVVCGFFQGQLDEARAIAEALENRLLALGSNPSGLKDMAMKLGGINWATFFRTQSDVPAKFVAFVNATLHLQIAGYELLARTAQRANDSETVGLCRSALGTKRSGGERLSTVYENSVQETLALVTR